MAIFGYIYLLFLPFVSFFYSMFGLWKNPKIWKKYVPFLVYFFFIGAYVYETNSVFEDLTRYIPAIEEFGRLSFSDVLQRNNDLLYARDVLFWFFGSLQVPHMVPAISTATVYAVALYITCDTAERYGREKYIWIIVLFQFAMLPYVTLINNVRNVFALSLIILAVYLDIVKKKRDIFVVACYIFGCLMHLSAVALILFRLLSRPLKNAFVIVVIFPLVFSPLVYMFYKASFLFNSLGNLGEIFNKIIYRLYGYMNFSFLSYAKLSLNSVSVKFDRTIMIIGMSIALILIWYGLRAGERIFMSDGEIYVFIGLIALTSIFFGVFMAMPNFWRFSAAFYTTFAMLIIPYIVQYGKLPLLLRIIIPIYAILGVLSLLMQVWKCTWIEFGNWMVAFFTANILTILYDVFKGINVI